MITRERSWVESSSGPIPKTMNWLDFGHSEFGTKNWGKSEKIKMVNVELSNGWRIMGWNLTQN